MKWALLFIVLNIDGSLNQWSHSITFFETQSECQDYLKQKIIYKTKVYICAEKIDSNSYRTQQENGTNLIIVFNENKVPL
jgi:hypothetical protein